MARMERPRRARVKSPAGRVGDADGDVAALHPRLAGEAQARDEVGVAEVLLLDGVQRREVLLAVDDLHAAQAAGAVADAGGGDGDARALRRLEDRFAVGD